MNPFAAGKYDGVQTYYTDVASRLRRVAEFGVPECRAALKVVPLQKSVRTAVLRRIRKVLAERPPVEGVCRVCGCTEHDACEGSCRWTDDSRTLCSACTGRR